ncbi:MAG: Holliday junction branch migration DNA helicase RuvB [Alphaproteobacteria bacterium]
MDRLVSKEVLPAEEEIVELKHSLRPLKLEDFLGQEQLKQNLKIFIEAAKKRSEPLDHILFYGPPGLGKTTLSQIVAHELGASFRSTSGPVIAKAGDLAALLTNLQPHDVLFIDEIHRLNPAVEEILYPAMEDFKLDLMIGEGPSARSVQIDLPPFTLIGATTRSGLITRPLRERFGIPLALIFYAPHELAHIVKRAALQMKLDMTEDGTMEIAKRSRGTPRIALRLLRRVRDITCLWDQFPVTEQLVDKALAQLEVDSEGFDQMDRRYLTTIIQHYNGGPVGIETIAAILSEQKDVLEDVIEPYLMQKGFMQRTPRGRMLTKTAYDYLNLPFPQDLATVEEND